MSANNQEVKRYSIIYADPPWKYRGKRNIPPNAYNKNRKRYGGVEDHYSTMTVEEIASLPVQDLAAKNTALFLWVTFPNLKEGLYIMEHWGFKYKTLGFSWIKTNHRSGTPFFGIGYYTKSNCEVCLLGLKGRMKPVSNKVSSVIISPRREHSRKPDEVRDKIVELFGDLPRIELFARQKTPGWDVWGNEVESDIELIPKKIVI